MSKMDIVELRLRRTVALIIDWYITNMLASIPITFFFLEKIVNLNQRCLN